MAPQRTLPQTQWARTHSANVVLDYIMRHSFTLHLGVLLYPYICMYTRIYVYDYWKCCYCNCNNHFFHDVCSTGKFSWPTSFICTKCTQRHMHSSELCTVLHFTTLCMLHVHAACSKKLICQFLLTNTRLCWGNKVCSISWPTSVSLEMTKNLLIPFDHWKRSTGV